VAVVWHRGEYGVWPATNDARTHVSYCGRSYHGGETVTIPTTRRCTTGFSKSSELSAMHELDERWWEYPIEPLTVQYVRANADAFANDHRPDLN
jgi:hypothetical protein